MRRILLAVVATALALVTAAPAHALQAGEVCRTFGGPAGSPGTNLVACIGLEGTANNIRVYSYFFNTGSARVEIHLSYVKLVRASGDVYSTQQSTFQLYGGNNELLAGPWRDPQQGVAYWARQRMWVCWPGLSGQPCGGAVVWNSNPVVADV